MIIVNFKGLALYWKFKKKGRKTSLKIIIVFKIMLKELKTKWIIKTVFDLLTCFFLRADKCAAQCVVCFVFLFFLMK